jgi:hypothetical protein
MLLLPATCLAAEQLLLLLLLFHRCSGDLQGLSVICISKRVMVTICHLFNST